MAAPVFVAAASNRALGPIGDVTVSKPTGTVDGHWMLALVANNQSGSTITAPAGWTQLYQGTTTAGANNARVAVFRKKAASEGANYTFTSDTLGTNSAAILTYSGVHPTDSFVFGTVTSAASGNPIRAVSLTTVADESAVVSLFVSQLLSGSWGVPSGTTSRAALENSGGNYSMALLAVDATQALAGASPERDTGESVFNTGWFGVQVALRRANDPPNAPTLLTPVGGTILDLAITQRFDWDFSDPNVGDTQSEYDLRYKIVGAGSWTTVSGATPNTFHDFAPSTFTAGDYEWQVATRDALGEPVADGDLTWSSSGFFTAAAAAGAPTITAPTSGGTVATPTFDVEWSAASQTHYQVRTVADAAGTANTAVVYTDSGEVASSSLRLHNVAFATNSRYEHIQVRIKVSGLWSAWASIRVQVSYTQPMTPTLVVTAVDTLGIGGTDSFLLTVTHPTPSGGAPTVASQNVWVTEYDLSGAVVRHERVAHTQTPGNYTYRSPASGRDHSFEIEAVGDNGTTALSALTA